MPAATLYEFLAELRSTTTVPRPPEEERAAMITCISTPGEVGEVDRETFDEFLNCLPPKWMGGSCFAFAEGNEALRIFWAKEGRYYVRQLTWDETKTFCRLAEIPLPW